MTVNTEFCLYPKKREGCTLMSASMADLVAAETRLWRQGQGSHWQGWNLWAQNGISVLVLLTSTKCKVCFVIFRYDDGSYELVGTPGQVLARTDDIGSILELLEDIVVY